MKAVLEKILVNQKRSITAFRYSKTNFETPWHFHPQYELTFIEKSTGTKFIGDFVGSYVPGELVLLGAHLPHCWKNSTHPANPHCISYVVQWNSEIFPQIPELESVAVLLKKSSRGLLFDEKETEHLILQLKHLPEKEDDLLIPEFLRLLILLSKCGYTYLSESSYMEKLKVKQSSRISMVHRFVENNFHRKIYLKELADLANLTEPSFSRFFTQTMGRPFFTFLNEYRINIASRMLADTDKTISEISYSCGYESLPFFHKQFQKFQKLTPAIYRKKHQI